MYGTDPRSTGSSTIFPGQGSHASHTVYHLRLSLVTLLTLFVMQVRKLEEQLVTLLVRQPHTHAPGGNGGVASGILRHLTTGQNPG